MKPEAELAAGGDITVQDGLPSKPGHNNMQFLRSEEDKLRKKLTSHDQGTDCHARTAAELSRQTPSANSSDAELDVGAFQGPPPGGVAR